MIVTAVTYTNSMAQGDIGTNSVDQQDKAPPEEVISVMPRENGAVFILNVKGPIEGMLFKTLQRGLDKAEEENAAAIILDMDTPGGSLTVTEDIVNKLLKTKIPTYTFVNKDAISAGAIIALACDHVYMTRFSRIGDAMPILHTTTGGYEAPSDGLKPKIMSPTLALIRMICENSGHNRAMAEAMVEPDKTFSFNGEVICAEGELLTLTAQEAAQVDNVTGKPLFSSGTVKDMDELLDKLGLSSTPVKEEKATQGEFLARLFRSSSISGLLLAVGMIGLFTEIRTPGFGFPGIIGITALMAWFLGQQIGNFSGILELVLLLLGFVLIWLELFVIPGFGVAGISGITLVFIAIFTSLIKHKVDGAWFEIPIEQIKHAISTLGLATVFSVIGCVLVAIVLPATPVFRKISLSAEVSASVVTDPESAATQEIIGHSGTTLSPLRPSGAALIDGKRMDVVAKGLYIEADTSVVVVACSGNHIEVRKA